GPPPAPPYTGAPALPPNATRGFFFWGGSLRAAAVGDDDGERGVPRRLVWLWFNRQGISPERGGESQNR
ncbi:MAG: hypothetical protein AAF328_06650, partial [Planctomycetota bacterium]